jgi:hypothetical protein
MKNMVCFLLEKTEHSLFQLGESLLVPNPSRLARKDGFYFA